MIVIVGSQRDQECQNLIKRWTDSHVDVVLCTCQDLSFPGWRHYSTYPKKSSAVIGKRVVKYEEITGVLTRRPFVFEQELVHISAEDRQFVAAEMNSFLIAWLSSLSCPVLNRPSARCLSGPNWRIEEWLHAAAGLGIATRSTAHKDLKNREDNCKGDRIPESVEQVITVIGEKYIGSTDAKLACVARKLAARAGTDLLEVRFRILTDGSYLMIDANPWPEIGSTALSDAILHHLTDNQAPSPPLSSSLQSSFEHGCL